MLLNRRDLRIYAVTLVVFFAVVIVAQLIVPALAPIIAVCLGVALLAFLQFRAYRGLILHLESERQADKQQRKHDHQRSDSLLSLYSILDKLTYPLPPMVGYAISPEFALLIATTILKHRPAVVLELGSGVSTIIASYCLRKTGGRLISLESDAGYCAHTKELLTLHGLSDVATVIHAPLKPVQLNGKTWQWYDTSSAAVQDLRAVGLLIVDGPDGAFQKHSRYPAVPLLAHAIDASTSILLDDANRADEREVVAMWLRELTGFSAEMLDSEKGAAVLKKAAQP